MSSTESSGAPAEATATTPASSAAPSFGSTRGSGLLRGKRPTISPASTATAASTEYTPTAIEVVTSPREYQNPFAPVETPVAAATPAARVVENPTPVIPIAKTDPVTTTLEEPAPVAHQAPLRIEPDAGSETDEPAALNILEPEQQKTAPTQTWESEGFRPAREPRGDRPRREDSRRDEPRRDEPRREERTERAEQAPFDPASIPEKFLYVRPGYNYVPTPSNYGGAPRERNSRPADAYSPAASAASAPAKSGGFLGWLKSLFGGSPAAPAAIETRSSEHRHGDRHRGGRGHGQGGGDGQRRRSRGGRGRSQSRGEYRGGGDQGGDRGGSPGGPSAT